MLTRIQHAAIVSENFVREADPEMREHVISEPSEGERFLVQIASCRRGEHQFSSPDGVLVDIAEQ